MSRPGPLEKTMNIIDALLGEHGVLYALLDGVDAGAPGWSLPEARAYAAALGSALLSHARVEDDLLFPAIRQETGGNAGPLDVMRQEHEEIEGSLRRIDASEDAGEVRSMLLSVALLAREHFEKEEQMLFPLAADLLGDERLQELGRSWGRSRNVAV